MLIDPHRLPAWVRSLAVVAFAIGIVGLGGYYLVASQEILDVGLDEWGLHDHRDAVYVPLQATLDGATPYDTPAYTAEYPAMQHFPVYAPGFLMMHLPFALLPIGVSGALYGLALALTFVGLAAVALRVSGCRIEPWLLAGVAAVMMATQPAAQNFVVGNNGAIFSLASMVTIYWWHRRPRAAGAALGISSGKPQFLIPLAAVSLARRRSGQWGTAIALAGALSAPLLIAYIAWTGGIGPFLGIIADNLSVASEASGAEHSNRIDLEGQIVRMVGGELPLVIVLALNIVVLATTAIAVRRIDGRGDAVHVIALLTALGIALTAIHYPYDGLVVIVPTAALFLSEKGWGGLSARRRTLLQVLLCGTLFNYLSSDSVLRALEVSEDMQRVVRSATPMLLMAAMAVTLHHVATMIPTGGQAREDHPLATSS